MSVGHKHVLYTTEEAVEVVSVTSRTPGAHGTAAARGTGGPVARGPGLTGITLFCATAVRRGRGRP